MADSSVPPVPPPPPPAAPLDPSLRRVVDVRDFGADARASDNSPAIQAALDWCATQPNVYGNVRFELQVSQSLACFGPVWADFGNVDLRGVAPGAGFTWYHQHGFGLALGMSRKAGGGFLPADLRVDSFGKLDRTAAPKPGACRGFASCSASTGRTAMIDLAGTSFGLGRGDGWEKADGFTLEVAVEVPDWSKVADHKPLLGGVEGNHSSPGSLWIMNGRPGWWWFPFATADGVDRRILVPLSTDGTRPAGPVHLACQVDLKAGTVSTFVDRKAVKPDLSGIGPGWGPGLKSWMFETAPFKVGGQGAYSTAVSSSRGDCGGAIFHGLRLSDAPLYAPAEPGSDQRSLKTGTVPTDKDSYLTADAATVGFVDFAYSGRSYPSAIAIHQRDEAGHDAAFGFAPVLPASGAGMGAWVGQGYTFRDLSLHLAADAHCGSAVTAMELRGITMERCGVTSVGAFGWQHRANSLNSYPLRFRDTTFKGPYAAAYLFGADATFDNANVDAFGRYGFLMAGSAAVFDKGFWSGGTTQGKCLFRLKPGTNAVNLVVRDVKVDQEMPYHGEAVVWADSCMPKQHVSLERFDFWSGASQDTPLVKLDAGGGVSGMLRVLDCYEFPMSSMVVVTNRARAARPSPWRGVVDGLLFDSSFSSGKVVDCRDGTDAACRIDVARRSLAPSPLPAPVPAPAPPAPR